MVRQCGILLTLLLFDVFCTCMWKVSMQLKRLLYTICTQCSVMKVTIHKQIVSLSTSEVYLAYRSIHQVISLSHALSEEISIDHIEHLHLRFHRH